MGIFIRVELDAEKLSDQHTARLPSLCPVDIFEKNGTDISVQSEQEDECVLCELCLDVAPVGAIAIHKTYMDETLISRALADAEN